MTKSHQVCAIVLAAGLSKRAGAGNKLLNQIEGGSMIGRVVENVVSSGASPVVVVTGHEADSIHDVLKSCTVEFTHNPNFIDGMGSSIAQGVAALPDNAEGVLICLGDMPHIQAETFQKLINAFDPEKGKDICIPVLDGRRGNPVLFGRQHFDALKKIDGDRGAKTVTLSEAGSVIDVPVTDEGIFVDYDTTPQSAE